MLVAMLDEEPIRLGRSLALVRSSAIVQSNQDPLAVELLALELKLEIAAFQSFVRISDRRPFAAVPDDDFARAVFAFRNAAFEFGVFDRMVFNFDRQPLFSRIERGTFGDGPAFENAVE